MDLSPAGNAKFIAEFGRAPRDAGDAISARLESYRRDLLSIPLPAVNEAKKLLPLHRDGSNVRDYMHKFCVYFKESGFEWVLRPKCQSCKQQCNGSLKYGDATAEEIAMGTIRSVEVWDCNNDTCEGSGRFPRYRNADTILLHTRQGRCGEWAKAFCLLCLACEDVEVRLVYDFTDHVWVEVRDDDGVGWVHVDVCEQAVDNKLMYESEWGKKLTWIFAIEMDGTVTDVTKSYTNDFDSVLDRRSTTGVDEEWLSLDLKRISATEKRALRSR